MRILIPTYRRVSAQRTYDSLCPEIREQARLVVHPDEADAHLSRGRKIVVCPIQGVGMATVRAWMMDYCFRSKFNKVLMLDDDVTIQKRREDLRVIGESTPQCQIEMIEWIDKSLDTYLHCAFTERSDAWADTKESREATKGIQCVGYNIRRVMTETNCRFDKCVPEWFFIEDYHMTLQLLRAGHPNLVSRMYRMNVGSSNSPGGCSSHRTPARMEEAAKLLERLHPGLVKAVEKETKTSFGGGKRWNVKVQWKKAFESSQKSQ